MAQFNFNLSDEIDQDAITTAKNICTLLQLLIKKGIINPLLTAMWYHTDGCENKYHCKSAIYILSCLYL